MDDGDHAETELELGLLERSAELAAVDRVLAGASAGSAAVLVVEGPAGIGKSSILHEAADRARHRACTVLTARGSELERDFPFGIVLQLVEPYLASLTGDERDELLAPLTPPARLLFEGPGDVDAETPSSRGGEAFVVLRGLHRLVAGITDRGPIALVVDDLQWCDEPSLRFLRYLTGRIDDLPAAVFLATRPGDAAVEDFVVSAGKDSSVTVVRPRPLSAAAIARLAEHALGRPPAADLVAECAAATGGTPFLLHELLTSLGPEMSGPAGDEGAAEMVRRLAPELLMRRVRHRLAQLPVEVRRFLHAVAVLGADAQLRNVVALTGMAEGDASAAADRLIDEEILEAGHTFAFSHPVLHAAAVAQLSATDRARLHARAFDVLRAVGIAPDRLAIHAAAAEPAARADIVDLLRAVAGRARARGAPDAAVAYLRRALAEPPDPSAHADVLVELAAAESAHGDPEALSRLHGALGLLDDPVRRAGVWERIGSQLLDAGERDQAADAFERGRMEVADRDPELALRLEAGYVLAARTNLATRAEAHRRLAAIVDRGLPGSGRAERKLLAEAAYQATLVGQRARASDLARRALAPGDDGAHGGSLSEAFYTATLVLLMTDEIGGATEAIEAGLRAARRTGSARMFAAASHLRAALEFRLGQLGECIVDAQAALDGARHGWNIVLPSTRSYLALCALEQGDVAAALAALELPGGDDRWSASSPYIYYLYGRGRVLAETGDIDAALATFVEVGRRQEVMGAGAHPGIAWRSWAATCLAARGERDEALRLVAEEVRLARAFGVPFQIGMAMATWGHLEAGPSGVVRLREAVALLERADGPLEEARARLRLGRLTASAGDPETAQASARSILATALDLARGCGANRMAAEIAGELEEVGGARGCGAATERDRLTPLERRVARMVAEGLTDRDIADALFLPARAVADHVASVRRKLRVQSVDDLRTRLRDDEAARRQRPPDDGDQSPIAPPSRTLIRFFGGTEVLVDGRPRPMARGVPTRLIQLLAARGGNVHADEVVEELWPGEEPGRGRARLRHVLYRVRQAVGPVVVRDGDRVRFDSDIEVDVELFEREAARAMAVASGDRPAATRLAAAAVARYRGEFLMDAPYEPWATAPRNRARRRYIELLELLAADARDRGRPSEALSWLEQAAEADPASEDRYVQAAAMAVELSRWATARMLLGRARDAAAHLGVPPSDALLRLEERIAAAH